MHYGPVSANRFQLTSVTTPVVPQQTGGDSVGRRSVMEAHTRSYSVIQSYNTNLIRTQWSAR